MGPGTYLSCYHEGLLYEVKNYYEDSRELWKGLKQGCNKIMFVLKKKNPSCSIDHGLGAAETGGELISYKPVAVSQVRHNESLTLGKGS